MFNALIMPLSHAATPFVVRDIRVEGLRHIATSTAYSYIPIKRGDRFTDESASDIVRQLYATGFFADVNVSADGDVVVVRVAERPVIATIDFAGIHEFDKDNLTKALKSVKLSAGAYYDKALIDKAEQELKRQYLTRGYYAADVTTTISPIDRNRVGVLFSVVEGPSAKIRQINFVGNHVFDDRTNGLRYSYGVGLEWISPIGPLKLNDALPIVRHAGDQYQKFQIRIGTSFQEGG
jgi:outer membrane protein insertion porin family